MSTASAHSSGAFTRQDDAPFSFPDLPDMQRRVVEMLPGCGMAMARDLLQTFGSVSRIVNATEAEFRRVRCIHPLIQQKQIWLQIAHKGWTRGLLIRPDTDLRSPDFVSEVLERFEKTRCEIDAVMKRQSQVTSQELSRVKTTTRDS